jgi:hypothetical protein
VEVINISSPFFSGPSSLFFFSFLNFYSDALRGVVFFFQFPMPDDTRVRAPNYKGSSCLGSYKLVMDAGELILHSGRNMSEVNAGIIPVLQIPGNVLTLGTRQMQL